MKVIHVPDTIKINDDVKKLTYRVCDNLADIVDIIGSEK